MFAQDHRKRADDGRGQTRGRGRAAPAAARGRQPSLAGSGSAPPATIIALQRAVGNAAVTRVIQRAPAYGAHEDWDDPYERQSAGKADSARAGSRRALDAMLRQFGKENPGTKVAVATPVSGKGDPFMAPSGYTDRSKGRSGTLEAREASEAALAQGRAGSQPPWAGIEQREGWPPHNCAESHLYAKMMMHKVNPRQYQLATYDIDGKVASPCKNCAQWVSRTFHSVVGANRDYRAKR